VWDLDKVDGHWRDLTYENVNGTPQILSVDWTGKNA